LLFLKNLLRNIDAVRVRRMMFLENSLYRVISRNSRLEKSLLPKNEIKRILIIRKNKRIGNILFLIPFIKQTRIAYPAAKIDVMVNDEFLGSFLRNMGIGDLYFSHFSIAGLFKWLKVINTANQAMYDLILVPNASGNDAVSASLINSRNKVAAYKKSRQVAFPNAVKVKHPLSRKHAACKPLTMFESLGHDLGEIDHKLEFSKEEAAQGKSISQGYRSGALTLAFFRGARGKKLLAKHQWETILTKFEKSSIDKITWVEILSPDVPSSLRADIKTYATPDLRLLGSVLKNFDGFICCDTGPLHLADAAGAKCIGLYSHTNSKTYGLLGKECFVVNDIEKIEIEAIIQKLVSA
jgi:ADP-heptose:LPS heptosyltransferase